MLRARSRMQLVLVPLLGLCLVGAKCASKLQSDDPDYWPVVASPAYPDGQGFQARVGLDESHNNRARVDNRYQGFTRLLEADGHIVTPFVAPFEPGCGADLANCAWWQALAELDVFAIVGARDLVSAEESALLVQWVSAGGALLVVGDHSPDPPKLVDLAAALGLAWSDISVRDAESDILEFAAATGLDTTHPIALGADASEQIAEVSTFSGSAFAVVDPEATFTSLLTLQPGAFYVDESNDPVDVGGMSQGMALEIGAGRVYASAEAMMFTALVNEFDIMQLPITQEFLQQVCDFVHYDEVECAILELLLLEPTGETQVVPLGMHTTPDNEQYLLNLMHWLVGAL